ncbi:hypothetical protein [Actinophytocola sp.]|uniref:hypothetical protein n=1 Tax=Actinophytocola sp. TaxID=1872138 RepID=UPI002ED3BAB7
MESDGPDVGTYDNAYFIFIDAAGHSTIIRNNPRDRAADGFDLLKERTDLRLERTAKNNGCATAQVWHWAGDGGFLIVHDDRESVSVATALQVARCLLETDLEHLRDEFTHLGIKGMLHLRIAVHKGALRYRGPKYRELLYGPAINLAAHLEKATPPDSVAISADVHRAGGEYVDGFELVGAFEGTDVYVLTIGEGTAVRSWLATNGLAGGTQVLAYHERPSQHEKARLVDAAHSEIVEIGSALHTCANYLVTRERPARYRQAVLDFLDRGGTYRCVLVDPASPAAELVGRQRGEDLPAKITESLSMFTRFKEAHVGRAERLEISLTQTYPAMAAFTVDIHEPQALLLYSPYLSPIGPDVEHEQRADMPHYLLSRLTGALFTNGADTVLSALASARRVL